MDDDFDIEETLARLQGSPEAKERLRVWLLVERGELTVPAACARLGITEAEFDTLCRDIVKGMFKATKEMDWSDTGNLPAQ
jgi:hypothetical protein